MTPIGLLAGQFDLSLFLILPALTIPSKIMGPNTLFTIKPRMNNQQAQINWKLILIQILFHRIQHVDVFQIVPRKTRAQWDLFTSELRSFGRIYAMWSLSGGAGLPIAIIPPLSTPQCRVWLIIQIYEQISAMCRASLLPLFIKKKKSLLPLQLFNFDMWLKSIN